MVSCFLQDTFGRKKCLILCRYYMYVIPNNGLPGTSFYILWPFSILISKLSSVSQVIGCLLLYLANSYAYLLAAFSFACVPDSDQEKLYQEPRPYSMLEFPIVPVICLTNFFFICNPNIRMTETWFEYPCFFQAWQQGWLYYPATPSCQRWAPSGLSFSKLSRVLKNWC